MPCYAASKISCGEQVTAMLQFGRDVVGSRACCRVHKSPGLMLQLLRKLPQGCTAVDMAAAIWPPAAMLWSCLIMWCIARKGIPVRPRLGRSEHGLVDGIVHIDLCCLSALLDVRF